MESIWEKTCKGPARPPLYGKAQADVAVIGGGDTAIEDALYLSARSHVTLIHRRAQLRATGRAVERAKANPNIEFCLGSPPERSEKSGAGLAVARANGVRIEADGVFIAVGTRPETALPVLPPEYGTTKTYRYGKIKLTVITRGNN